VSPSAEDALASAAASGLSDTQARSLVAATLAIRELELKEPNVVPHLPTSAVAQTASILHSLPHYAAHLTAALRRAYPYHLLPGPGKRVHPVDAALPGGAAAPPLRVASVERSGPTQVRVSIQSPTGTVSLLSVAGPALE
jgi:hypothetical protein